MSTDQTPQRELTPQETERRDHIFNSLCPAWKSRLERGCLVLKKGKAEYLIEPAQDVCDRCWQRAQEFGITECRNKSQR